MVKFFLTKYLLYDFLLRYGGEVFLTKYLLYDFLVRSGGEVFLTKYLLYDFLLRYGGEVFLKDEVSSVWSILACCRSGGIQLEVVFSYTCLCLCNRYYAGLFEMTVGVQLSTGNSAPNSGNNHHLTIPFEGGMHSFKRQGACVSRN